MSSVNTILYFFFILFDPFISFCMILKETIAETSNQAAEVRLRVYRVITFLNQKARYQELKTSIFLKLLLTFYRNLDHTTLSVNIQGTRSKVVQCTRRIIALTFFAILIFSDKSIFLSKYIVLYALSWPIDYPTFKFTC